MSTLILDRDVFAKSVEFTEDAMIVSLDDGRSVSVPLAWFPRLSSGTPSERENYELIGQGEGIHWPSLNEDISVESVIAGRRSAESAESLQRWLSQRASK